MFRDCVWVHIGTYTQIHTHVCMCKFTLLWRTLCAKMAAIQKQCPSEALVLKRDWRMGGRGKKKKKKEMGVDREEEDTVNNLGCVGCAGAVSSCCTGLLSVVVHG